MEVYGRKEFVKQLQKAESRQDDIFCQPCQGEDENVLAESYCETCNAFICSSCLRAHRKLPITKNHVIKSKDEMPRTLVQTDPCTELCAVHKTEIVKFYCQSHDEVGCGDCMVVHHKTCKVDLVPDVSGNYGNSEELKHVKHHIAQLVKEITARKHDVNCKLKAAAKVNLKIVEEIKMFRKDMNMYLDIAEAELLNDVEQLRKADVSLQSKLQDECDSMQKDMEEYLSTLDRNTKRLNQLFVSAKLAQKKLKVCQDSVKRIGSGCKINMFKFKPAQSLVTLQATKPTPLGALSVLSKVLVDMRLEFVKKLNVQAGNEKEDCWITGLALISGDLIVLADLNNNALKILNMRENKISSIYKLAQYPWAITVINPRSVAVTVPEERRILFMNTKYGLSESHSLKVRGKCHGIDHKNGVLAVSFSQPAAVQILNMTGNVLHELSNTSMSNALLYIALSPGNESVYVSDFYKHTVYELTMDGQLKAAIKFEDKSYPRCVSATSDNSYPRGLAVTIDGTVFVCCQGVSNKVSMIDPNRKKLLYLPAEHVQKPVSILVCEEQNKLYICEHNTSKDCNNMKVFDMK